MVTKEWFPGWAAHAACAAAAVAALLLAPHPSQAAPTTSPTAAGSPIDCKTVDGRPCDERHPADEDRQREAVRNTEGGPAVMDGGMAIVPCVTTAGGSVCGISTQPPPFTLSPLTVRRYELSAGIDHALSDRWAIGALIGLGRGRLHRLRTEPGAFGSGPNVEDTTIHTRSTTLAATLSWFGAAETVVDATLSAQRSTFELERIDTPQGRRFIGSNAGRGWGLSVTASRIWRRPGLALIPQIGVDQVSSTVDPLVATIDNPLPNALDTFRVTEQRSRTLSALLGLQAQWPHSTRAGVLVPYVRALWRERLSQSRSAAVASAPGKPDEAVVPDEQQGRRTLTLAAGLLGQLTRGVALFGDLGYSRGSGQVRDTRLSLGIKFER